MLEWNYDKEINLYMRNNGGQSHLDLETKKQLTAKNVVVLVVKEKASVDKNLHFIYENIGKGEAVVFQDGQVIKATWQKPTRESRTKLLDQSGKEIAFNRGPIWFETVGTAKSVSY